MIRIALTLLLLASTAAADKPAALAIGGEKLVRHDIIDAQQNNMVAARVMVPEHWKLTTTLVWHYEHADTPIDFSAAIENPANGEAYFTMPEVRLIYIEVPPQYRQYMKHPSQPGDRLPGGAIWLAPMQAGDALALFIKRTRGAMPKFAFVARKSLAGLPRALGADGLPGAEGVAIKCSYELDGKPVEEAFFAIYWRSTGHGAGQAAALVQTNWGLTRVHSFRAPAGQLERRMTLFSAIEKSLRPDPAWQARATAIVATLQAQVAARVQKGWDDLAAANAIRDQAMRDEKAFDRSIEAQMAANRAAASSSSSSASSGDGEGSKRSVQDKFDDLYRGVDTTDDPYWGQSQHSNLEQYHWTDGYGNYRDSNDPNYKPGQYEAGDWQLMQNQ